MTHAFDVDAIRTDFPILAREVHGRPLVYLDNAASAQKPQAVIDAMTGAMTHAYANVHRGLHTLANETTEAFEGARSKVAGLLNAAGDEIVFTRGSTEAINLVANGIAEHIQPGDEIVLSVMEHHSNIVPWHFLRERHGAVLKWVDVTEEGLLDRAGYEAALGPRTKIVALTHCSNVLGTKTDGAEIVRLAHEVGARVLLDGSQAVVHGTVDVKALDVDFYVFTGHKLYGPSGVGALYAKREHLETLRPYQGGGEMIASVSQDGVTYADAPHKFEAGTPAIIEAIGLGAAIDYVSGFDRAAVEAHEHALLARAMDGLSGLNGLRVLGHAPDKAAILSFTFEDAHAHDIAQLLDRYGVAVRAGHHCAEPLMRRFGVNSTARASFALYNTAEEVDAFLTALDKTRAFLS